MTIPITSLFSPSSPTTWLTTLLTGASTLGLPTTAWLSGDPLRTTYQVVSVELSKEDSIISQQAQGGFLDFAATGTYTITDIDGATVTLPVSPDPSITGQNPGATPTWIDLLASSVFGVKRTAATAATNTLQLVNTTGASLGTFLAGTFHVGNPTTGATYSNQATLTISPSTVVGTSIASVSYVGGVVTVTTTANHGLASNAVVFLTNVPGLTGASVGVLGTFASIAVTGATTFTLNGVSFTGAPTYTGAPLGKVYLPQALTFAADLVGTVGNAGIGQITQPINAIPGGAVCNLVSFTGSPWQSNTSLAAMCRGKLATLSPNGPKGAYLFYALVSSLILSGQPVTVNGPVLANPLPAHVTLDGGAITRVLVTPALGTGTVTVVLANATGPVAGCINNPISNVTAASPAVVTSAGHGLQTGDYAQVNGVLGMTGVNGVFQITRIDANNFSLNGSTGVGAFIVGFGQVSGGDLYAVESVLVSYTDPNAVTVVTQSANAVVATITAQVFVPSAFVTQYQTALSLALPAFFASFPIGGLSNIDNSQSNVLPLGAIEGLLYAIGNQSGVVYTQSVFNVLINGSSNDLALSATGVAQLGVTTGIQVIGI